ncbi:aspartate kinase [Riemerella anatipestifer]|uniref:Aspartokinase n=1 Tax=Riemerella anatipestifer (strain ATCC 11845 / DSM 15868 / JCM 9532 / NCTC 11014) TaxID=693978 RepID=E4T9V2_RIEAD|nr:aspartate kinase [Riemerella anatipestifer]ADQ81783.1 aspartate kinase [Riemerella anatipestifer ATCC 11845 = DSM 15868]AFD55794.1 aspartate kinase [Riemerella anatipestifer ATCC 11845 = DSM 15868]MDD1525465.1 aspartate kinase [Riemerella anatipestifer]MRM91623.1 aspartate kinase [Riemerella anatipestifer]MRN04693.1 aspartate kinase [Riemerella anatipestifer]
MKIFKFGGASVKDSESVKNVAFVLESQGFKECLLVVSAMGKTTNALEKVVEVYFQKGNYNEEIQKIKTSHIEIASGLFDKNHPVFDEISLFFDDVQAFLRRNKSPNYNFVYDQVVSCGEMISSKILSEYLNSRNFSNEWIDARDFIKTNDTYREGVVDWTETETNISQLNKEKCYVTQGFIGSDANNFTVTLGREGSDYSAAIFAYCLNANAMTIWKDVPGVMTGDPRKFKDVKLLSNISYEEAIEMAYYGASVIHPKTLQPLKQKNIPFFVKSFVEPQKAGTKVGISDENQKEESFILKENQNLIKISTRDFSFIAEDHISFIFNLLSQLKIKVSLMQNSAISLALCLEDKFAKLDELNEALQANFKTEVSKNVSLFTIRNANMDKLDRLYEGKNILLEQIAKNTVQIVIL